MLEQKIAAMINREGLTNPSRPLFKQFTKNAQNTRQRIPSAQATRALWQSRERKREREDNWLLDSLLNELRVIAAMRCSGG